MTKKISLTPLAAAIGLLCAAPAFAAGLDFSGSNIYMKFLDGNQLKANHHLDEFPEDAFVGPPFSFKGGIGHAEQVFGGRENLRRVLASLNSGRAGRGQCEVDRSPFALVQVNMQGQFFPSDIIRSAANGDPRHDLPTVELPYVTADYQWQ